MWGKQEVESPARWFLGVVSMLQTILLLSSHGVRALTALVQL